MTRENVVGIREQNGRRREAEKAAAYLRERGATCVRGVYHKRPGWWSADNVFLGSRSIEARAELERLNGEHEDPAPASSVSDGGNR